MAEPAQVALRDIAAPGGLVGGPFGSSLVNADYTESGVPVIRGSNFGSQRYVTGPYAFVSIEKFSRDLARNAALPGDVVFTQRGTLGQVAVVPASEHAKFVISQSQMRLRVESTRADNTFVYYAARDARFLKQVADRAISTGVPHINLGILADLTIPLPPLPQQRAIAEVLGALDDKIAANTRIAEVAHELRRQLYLAALRRGHTRTTFLDFIEVTMGEPFGGSSFAPPGTGRPLIRIRDLKTGTPQVWSTETRAKETIVSPGDVLVGMDADFSPSIWLGHEALLNQRVCLIRSRHSNALTIEASRPPLEEIARHKTGTTVIHLNKRDLATAAIEVPTAENCAWFDERASALTQSLVSLTRESEHLLATRDALLPALMSARLRVKDAEKVVSDAV